MLDIFTMLGNEGGAEFAKGNTELGDELGSDKLFDGLLGRSVTVYIYVKLSRESKKGLANPISE